MHGLAFERVIHVRDFAEFFVKDFGGNNVLANVGGTNLIGPGTNYGGPSVWCGGEGDMNGGNCRIAGPMTYTNCATGNPKY